MLYEMDPSLSGCNVFNKSLMILHKLCHKPAF